MALGKDFLVLLLLQLKLFELQNVSRIFSYLSHPLGHHIYVLLSTCVNNRDPKYFKQRGFRQKGELSTAVSMCYIV